MDAPWLWTRPSVVWATMGLLLLSFRTALWLRYRPAVPATFADAPPPARPPADRHRR